MLTRIVPDLRLGLLVLLGAFVLALPHAAAAQDGVPECFPPGAPEVPDGNTASGPDMVRVEQRMKLFRESAQVYAGCMDDKLKRYGARVPERRKQRWVTERQKVVDAIQSATQRYNDAVKLYRARLPENAGSTPQPPPQSTAPKTGS